MSSRGKKKKEHNKKIDDYKKGLISWYDTVIKTLELIKKIEVKKRQ